MDGSGVDPSSLEFKTLQAIQRQLLNDESFMSGQSKENYVFKTIVTMAGIIGQRPIYFDSCLGCKKKIMKQND